MLSSFFCVDSFLFSFSLLPIPNNNNKAMKLYQILVLGPKQLTNDVAANAFRRLGRRWPFRGAQTEEGYERTLLRYDWADKDVIAVETEEEITGNDFSNIGHKKKKIKIKPWTKLDVD